MLVLDSHNSRCHPDCMEQAKALGFDIFLLPGGCTAYLQLMDQLFGEMKRPFTEIMRALSTATAWGQISPDEVLRQWAAGKREWIHVSGVERVTAALADMGVWPPNKSKALANVKKKGERWVKYLEELNDADVFMLGDNTAKLTGLASRVKRANEVADAPIDLTGSRRKPVPLSCFKGREAWQEFADAKETKKAEKAKLPKK